MSKQKTVKDVTRNLAQFTSTLAKQTQEELNKVHRILDQTNEVVAALVHLIGAESVENAIMEMREEQRRALQKQQEHGVAHLKEKGILAPAEAITAPDGFVVGEDTLADGTTKRVQFEMAGIRQEFLPLYVGKKVGDVIEGAGAKLTVKEVYTVDRAKYVAVLEEQKKSAEPAPAEAAAPAPEATPT